ncbi:hypothetical protein NL676_029419 [Syzygium grande]|nr:hypothetical protein NL676_029419 [Syzygium grande]
MRPNRRPTSSAATVGPRSRSRAPTTVAMEVIDVMWPHFRGRRRHVTSSEEIGLQVPLCCMNNRTNQLSHALTLGP